MAELIIKRVDEWVNRFRDYRIILDEVEIGKIGNKEEKCFPISSGNHTLQLKIDWMGSKKNFFIAEQNESSCFEVSSFRYKSWIPILFQMLLKPTDEYLILSFKG